MLQVNGIASELAFYNLEPKKCIYNLEHKKCIEAKHATVYLTKPFITQRITETCNEFTVSNICI